MDANKDIFGQYLPYETPELNEEHIEEITIIVNAIADDVLEQISMDEFIKQTSNDSATILYVCGIVNKLSLPDTPNADINNIGELVRSIVAERIELG